MSLPKAALLEKVKTAVAARVNLTAEHHACVQDTTLASFFARHIDTAYQQARTTLAAAEVGTACVAAARSDRRA